MITNSEVDRDPYGICKAAQTPARWVQIGFCATSIAFNLCLIAQLLTVGVAYFNDPAWH